VIQFNPNLCNNGTENGKEYLMNYLTIDVFIDAYVMARLMQILRKSQTTMRNRSYFFTIVMYWNLLNVLTALWYHILVGLSTFGHSPTKYALLIALSYLISIDTENKKINNRNN